ncbi:MAG: response regulator [Proteobacteria bacterium]|nr:response regulator [Pseudomonadota bacterium]
MINKGKILAVDDTPASLRLLTDILKAEGYDVRSAISGEMAINAASSNLPDLVLLDIRMPLMDGYEVCRRLKADPATCDVPVIFLSAASEIGDKVEGFKVGAVDYVTKPFQMEELLARVCTHLELNRLRHHLEELVVKRTNQLVSSHRDTIVTMTRAASYKDEETGAHVARVSSYCVALAQALGMDAEFCDLIQYASPMHDVGKIAIPDVILGKPGRFEPHEWAIMKTHAELGAKMLSGTDSPYLIMGAEIAGGHHERWNGSGYPLGLKGADIPLSARITQICDVYDALRSRRPYKEAFSHECSVEIILAGDGRTLPSHFDPAVLEAFNRCLGRFREIFEIHKD